MFFIKLFRILLRELCHLDVANREPILLNKVDDLSCVHVTVGLDHRECLAFLGLEFGFGELVCVVDYLELSCVYVQHCADENILQLEIRVLSLLQEHLPALQVEHLNRLVLQVVCQIVGTHQ